MHSTFPVLGGLYTILYKETVRRANPANASTCRINNLRVCNSGSIPESRPAHQKEKTYRPATFSSPTQSLPNSIIRKVQTHSSHFTVRKGPLPMLDRVSPRREVGNQQIGLAKSHVGRQEADERYLGRLAADEASGRDKAITGPRSPLPPAVAVSVCARATTQWAPRRT